jgi:hypothetical protein
VRLNSGIEFKKVDPTKIVNSLLSSENQSFLLKNGFLGWVSPHLYFGDFEDGQVLPKLENWSWLNDWKTDKVLALDMFSGLVVVGSGPNDEPLVTKPNESPIYLVSSDLELVLLNSSLEYLTGTASAFLDMVDLAHEIDPNSIQNCSIPKELINCFISRFKTLDGLATNKSIWVEWAHERSKNL